MLFYMWSQGLKKWNICLLNYFSNCGLLMYMCIYISRKKGWVEVTPFILVRCSRDTNKQSEISGEKSPESEIPCRQRRWKAWWTMELRRARKSEKQRFLNREYWRRRRWIVIRRRRRSSSVDWWNSKNYLCIFRIMSSSETIIVVNGLLRR